MIKNAILLPAGVGVEPEEILIEDYESIQSLVGGLFDVVQARGEAEDGDSFVLCGYVSDDGLLTGMETNYLATALFGQELAGPCVVTWGLSPNGEYDGDDYDMPKPIIEWITTSLLVHVAEAYNESLIMHLASMKMVADGSLTEAEYLHMNDAITANVDEGTPLDAEAEATMVKVADYVDTLFTQAKEVLSESMDMVLGSLQEEFSRRMTEKEKGE